MKPSKILVGVFGLGVLGLGAVMAALNPSDAAFDEFALEQVKIHGCKEVPKLVRNQCPQFVQDNQAQVKKLIAQSTERQNYLFFSHYRTKLTARSIIPELPLFLDVPTFRLETVGIFGKFYIYESERQRDDKSVK